MLPQSGHARIGEVEKILIMITYVNTVLVTNEQAAVLSAAPAAAASMSAASADKGKFVIMNCDPDIAANDLYTINANTKSIKIGVVTGKNFAKRDSSGNVTYLPIVKWSNVIRKDDIRSFHELTYTNADSEDVVTIDFTNMGTQVLNNLALGEKRIIVRLTFKDLPTRYRKWTESYEYVTKAGDTAATIASGIAAQINGQWKRARVTADGTTTAGVVVLTAMPYDDDDAIDTLNWAAKVRFNANVYYTDPSAAGFASRNKYFIDGVTITKVPGKQYPASAKLVRDREAQGMGYEGILNREAWPAIKPDMVTDLAQTYDALTLEFENMYRAADDIFRKTKQTVEMYVPAGSVSALKTALAPFAGTPVNNNITY